MAQRPLGTAPRPPVCPLSLCLRQGHRGPCEVEEVVWGPESSPLSLKKGKLRPREGWRVSGGQKRPSLGSESGPPCPQEAEARGGRAPSRVPVPYPHSRVALCGELDRPIPEPSWPRTWCGAADPPGGLEARRLRVVTTGVREQLCLPGPPAIPHVCVSCDE